MSQQDSQSDRKPQKNTYVLAFDIERSGARDEHQTIAIGASVVDSNLEEVGSFFETNFRSGGHLDENKILTEENNVRRNNVTFFEPRCWNEFRRKNTHILKKLEYKGNQTMKQQEKRMTRKFQEFRSHWERMAQEEKTTLDLVSDNNVYDGGFINQLIFQHTKDQPLPYSASRPQTYQPFWEVFSMQKGMLSALGPSFNSDWGLSKDIAETFCLPKHVNQHDHMPHNDAYTIAWDYHILKKIQSGDIKPMKKRDPFEDPRFQPWMFDASSEDRPEVRFEDL